MKRRSALCTALVLGGALLGASGAEAQAPHFIPPPMRSLAERAAEAELIVIARIVRVEAGRIEVATEATLRGAPPARFEVKRSPLRPPALAVGDRALLFLRGDRAPFVLSGSPEESVALENAGQSFERALRGALSEPQSVGERAALWLALLETGHPAAAVRALAEAELSALCRTDRVATLAAILPDEGERPPARRLLAARICGRGPEMVPTRAPPGSGTADATTPITHQIAYRSPIAAGT